MAENVVKRFISIPESECEVEVEPEPGVFVKEVVKAPARPRYVAVTSKYVYWTSAGRLDEEGNPEDITGTIGRAELDGNEVKDIDPNFICGASNPQGIAANATHLYWANAAKDGNRGAIGRANIEGEEAKEVEQEFLFARRCADPFGVTLDAPYAYFTSDNVGSNLGLVGRLSLKGLKDGPFAVFGLAEPGLRGLATDGTNLYWASQREHAIGRISTVGFLTSPQAAAQSPPATKNSPKTSKAT